jgi:large subunit ribosomal protein L22
MGRAYRINKRTSHITVVVESRSEGNKASAGKNGGKNAGGRNKTRRTR